MRVCPLTRAWSALLLLSGLSTVIASLVTRGLAPVAVGGAILVLAWLKARVILSRYLGLWKAPGWRAGFNWVLGFYCLLLLALYFVPTVVS
ncbi:hypothetical protein [Tropicimonas marinistellae]|uniref:hypothetical protein n=1 Tax=Tropicimonas marinistellae TaxID=1739787 RepID=UPI000833DB57|nr:hypothetical protein [Tropicimonas marinistellae]